jgi:hypothetical protein
MTFNIEERKIKVTLVRARHVIFLASMSPLLSLLLFLGGCLLYQFWDFSSTSDKRHLFTPFPGPVKFVNSNYTVVTQDGETFAGMQQRSSLLLICRVLRV